MSFKVGTVLVLCALLVAIAQGYITGRIIGGGKAQSGQFPYQVSVRSFGLHVCGGSIISEKFILTAAHCVLTLDEEDEEHLINSKHLSIRAGSKNRLFGGVVAKVKSITVNENYNDEYVADVAVLELKEPLTFSSQIQPIQLATEDVPSGSDVIISGWGLTQASFVAPVFLSYTTVKANSSSNCFEKLGVVSDKILCLDHKEGIGACHGDSGGPATYNGKLVGVSGFSFPYCATENPDGYAKVSSYVDWINSIIA